LRKSGIYKKYHLLLFPSSSQIKFSYF